MVSLSYVRESNANLKSVNPSITAVFAGGTSGIGEATLKALASSSESPSVYIIGRSEDRASRIIKECKRVCPKGLVVFLRADLSLLRNVDGVCSEILRREPEGKLDLLFMSQGYLTFEGRKDTLEGLDTLMCLRYYSRMRLLYNLTPLLTKASSPRVVSIFAAGKEGHLYPDDLSLRKHYGLFNNISHVAFMTTFFFEELRKQHPTISCLHVYPGMVKTAEFENGLFPQWLKWFFAWVMLPLITPLCISVQECGERNLFHSTSAMYPASMLSNSQSPLSPTVPTQLQIACGIDGRTGSGVYNVDWDGKIIGRCESVFQALRAKDMNLKVWEHTMKAFQTIEKGDVFEE